ncbi:MAG: AAA family ATPase [Eubacterium sp.]|nr:AAA family ATPase [Eubacterium sp.]
MKELFITNLAIKKVRHLNNISIPLSEQKMKHLILTGKNGSGKTSVTESLAKYLNKVFSGEKEQAFRNCQKELGLTFNMKTDNISRLADECHYILAYYRADRVFQAEQPRHVEKVQLKDDYGLKEYPRNEFVKYLLDLKMTEALARNNNKTEKADGIKAWFENLEKLMRTVFADETVEIEFDEETFEFHILQQGKEPFDFNTLSSGYQAVLDIVLDIIMRMQYQIQRSINFDLPGIVLIDEIETHLHLELQKKIMPFLTTIFPNIQFVVTSHSPFILNSIENAVIYDLENHLLVENGLDNVPYDGIVEGYFRADKLSNTLREKFEDYQELVKKERLSDDEWNEIAELEMYLDEVPDYLALELSTEYRRLKLEFMNREDIDG